MEKLAKGNRRNSIIFVMNVTKPGSEEKIILTTLLAKNIGIGKFVVKPLP